MIRRVIDYYKNLYAESETWVSLVTSWFIIGAILGGLAFFVYPQLLQKVVALFADRFGPDPALNTALMWDIFLNNLKVSLIAIFGGLLLGLAPFIIVLTNGFILGFIIFALILSAGAGQSLLLLGVGILPHGIFEIPAFLIAAGFGLKLGIEWLQKGSQGRRWHVLWSNLKTTILSGIPLIVVVLFIAAIMEVFVSGRLLEYFSK